MFLIWRCPALALVLVTSVLPLFDNLGSTQVDSILSGLNSLIGPAVGHDPVADCSPHFDPFKLPQFLVDSLEELVWSQL
jgi:hypothetical protein